MQSPFMRQAIYLTRPYIEKVVLNEKSPAIVQNGYRTLCAVLWNLVDPDQVMKQSEDLQNKMSGCTVV